MALVGDMDAAKRFVQDYPAPLSAQEQEVVFWIYVWEIVALMFTWLGDHETLKMQKTKHGEPNPEEQNLSEKSNESSWTLTHYTPFVSPRPVVHHLLPLLQYVLYKVHGFPID